MGNVSFVAPPPSILAVFLVDRPLNVSTKTAGAFIKTEDAVEILLTPSKPQSMNIV
jgi:hypothetical protein